METGIPLPFPLARALWSPPVDFAPVDLTEHVVDDERRLKALDQLAQMHQ